MARLPLTALALGGIQDACRPHLRAGNITLFSVCLCQLPQQLQCISLLNAAIQCCDGCGGGKTGARISEAIQVEKVTV
jgi:hypothetical protein